MWALWESADGPEVRYIYETQTNCIVALWVILEIVVCHDWESTYIVSAIILFSQRKLMLFLVCCLWAVYRGVLAKQFVSMCPVRVKCVAIVVLVAVAGTGK